MTSLEKAEGSLSELLPLISRDADTVSQRTALVLWTPIGRYERAEFVGAKANGNGNFICMQVRLL